ncbi:hypothetical protein S7711_10132, partial [Stachybotrys chartarum IBT 7711]
MSFPFNLLCDLLNRLETIPKSSSVDRTQEIQARTVVSWFYKHDEAIPRRGSEAIAFLSCLFPERRPDRVFGLSAIQLEKIIEQAQCLGSSRMKDLQRWKANDGADFASCVERVMKITDCEPRLGPNVTLDEIDEILDQIAASSPFSSVALKEKIKRKYTQSIRRDNLLSRLFQRLISSEAKWMIRMLSKNYSPAHVPETVAMSEFHFLLPDILRFQSTIQAAVELLDTSTIRCMPIQPAADARDGLREVARQELKPQVGTIAVRSIYEKARSINHCCQLAGARRMSVERKYDGEYCQIHVDLNESGACIKIFSKSGRDSTNDRIGVHLPLRDSLGLNTIECKIKKQCILEGELLVWNDDHAIAQRWEGLVLKGCDDPYFSFNRSKSFIKLKKDYIPGLGDTADFVIIGGSRDAREERELGIGKLWWTAFYLACVENKNEFECSNSKPIFRIVDLVDRHGISKDDIVHLNRHGYFGRTPFATSILEFDVIIEPGRKLQPTDLFKYPFTVEVVGAGFDKPANAAYFTLRFPRVLKIHEDRSFRHAASFEELQEMARECQRIPDDLQREEETWLRILRSGTHLGKKWRESRRGRSSSLANGYVDKQGVWDQKLVGTAAGSLHEGNNFHSSSKRKIASENLTGGSLVKRA